MQINQRANNALCLIAKYKSQLKLQNLQIYDFIKRLIEIICSSSNDTLCTEAAKCLGEIGSLKLNGFSYYFETDISFYRTEAVLQDPMEYFTECLLNTVDNILLNYNKKTILTVCLVCEKLVNSRNGIKLLNSLSYMNVFRGDSFQTNYLNLSTTMDSIDMLTALKSTALLPYEQWICTFVAKLYAFLSWKDFEELSCCDTAFAESSLIPLFKILVSKKDVHLDNILKMLDYFFNEVFTAINENTLKNATIYREKRIIKHFLDICECVRISNEWNMPKVNLLYVAKACNYCQAYFLAIIFLEMWCVQERNADAERTNNDIMSNELFQDVSLKAYESIGCCDAISGFINPMKSRLEFLNIEGTWSDVLLHADAIGLNSNTVYADNLKKNGLISLANLNQNAKSIDYEICWRLCQWDTVVEGHSKINTLNDMEHEFKKHHFNSVKCIYKREEINSLAAISNARNCVVSILREISLECLQSVYKYLTWLQLLQHVEDFCQVQFTSSKEVGSIFEKWKIEGELEYGNFFCKEQILSHHATLFKTAGIRANRKVKEYFQDTDPLELCLLQCIKSCKRAGEINLASRNIAILKNMKLSNEQIQVNVLLEDAEVCLKLGKSEITKAILSHLIKNKDFAFCLQRVKAFRMFGEYLMESNTETFETVLNKFFKGSIELLNQFDKNKEKILLKNPHLFKYERFNEFERKNRKRAYESMAKYADREYTQLNLYSNSVEFQMKSKIIQENRQAADLIGKQNKDRDKNIGAIFMKKFANLDEKEILSVIQRRTDNLCIAIESYMKFCIIDQAITSPAIYRIIALWFANKQNESLQSKIEKDIGAIPSYKFLCALNQMTARLNSKNQNLLLLLRDILVRCAQDHPHHTYYQLFALVNAFSDSNNSTSNDRVTIAKDIINRSKNKANSLCIKQLETMFPALIDFANEKTTDNKVSISEKIRRMKNLDAIQCPTVELTVAISKAYNITSIVKWDDKVVLVGGINAPKKLTCLCSDGIKRSQLLKGKDDLRQDAVMQQVFSMINDLLRSETETNQRKLNLRTYKVVPLSMRSGILEWCQNTIPIGMYLSGDGKNGAHKKYRPNDYTIQKCRSLSMQHLKSDADKRLQIYLHICSNIQPVFHYFFFEKFLAPGEWFERRLAYINSVATNSIVGFILGLGDRHTQNILIDEKTAEVIHIDFGIAFEQGKIMPTPETVLFRLTRDMVAPMGVCETNGLFKKSCEATMRTLRRNQAVITTILEVLLYDPLYIWRVVQPDVDDSESEQTNLTAQRALLCVQNKLEGKQAGVFGISEVDVQVQRLINDAILSQNLCLMYPGWDPYL